MENLLDQSLVEWLVLKLVLVAAARKAEMLADAMVAAMVAWKVKKWVH